MNLVDTLKKAQKFYASKPAIACGEHRFTYGQFVERINGLSRYLTSVGIARGGKAAILHPNCHYFLETYYAVAQLGAATVPINVRLAAPEIAFILNHSESQVLIADPGYKNQIDAIRKECPGIRTIIWTGRGTGADVTYEEAITGQQGTPLPDIDIHPEETAQIYYTSGTTGKPKGVMLSHKNVYVHALGTIAELHLTDRDVWIHVAPLFHLADAWATWAITWVGGTHVIIRDFEPKTIFAAIEKEKVTITNLIPTMLNLMVNHPDVGNYSYSSLRVLLSGGAPIAPEVVRKIVEAFGCDYVQTYGMTETSPYLTLSLLKDHLKALPEREQMTFKAKTGKEFIGVRLRVVNGEGQDVGADEQEVGEIIVKGDTVTAGYWKAPEETEKAIINGWLHTGDMAVIDREGYVTIVDRKKDMILTGGENVYSTEVENVLYMHPAILECAVIGVPDPKWGEAVKALVVLKPGKQAAESEIIQFCKNHIAHYKSPKTVELIDVLPKTGSGKIQKKDLRDKYWEGYEKRVH